MALSQKHAGLMLVPWFNSKEWIHVKDLIFKDSSSFIEKNQALDILKIWKLRTPKLPSGVEGTLIILEALQLDNASKIDEKVLCGFYATSLMRFLNISAAKNDKQGTFYQTAKRNNLPHWLIDLRHEIAHDQHIPSIFNLKLGLNYSLDWLKTEYWEKQLETLEDFVIYTHSNEKIKNAIELYCQVNLIYYLNQSNIKCLEDIGMLDLKLQEQISTFHNIVIIDPKTEIRDVKKVLLKTISEAVNSANKEMLGEIVSKTLIENKAIFAMETSNQDQEIKLPTAFETIWHDIINLLYSEDMLQSFIIKLLELGSREVEEHIQRKTSTWLVTLFENLLDAKANPQDHSQLLFPSEFIDETLTNTQNVSKKFQLIADRMKEVHKDILFTPNIHMLNYLHLLLKFAEYSEKYIKNVEELIKLYIIPKQPFDPAWIVRTLDLPVENVSTPDIPMETQNDSILVINSDVVETMSTRRWKLIKDTSIFEGCPLGVLPGQSTEVNPILFPSK